MLSLYSLVIKIYGLLITIASHFYPKAKLLSQGRRKQSDLIRQRIDTWARNKKVWIHAASYGEYEMAKPIVRKLEEDPSLRFVISFHSPSGYEHIHFDDNRFLKIYLPLDTVEKQSQILELIQPDKVVFIKYEFWFNLLNQLSTKGIPYYFTSLHLNANSYLFKKTFNPFLNLLKSSAGIYCHNADSLAILKKNGFRNAVILGDTRINQVLETKTANNYDFEWPMDQFSIALGSIIPSEYKVIAQLINSNPDKNFLLAPHEIDEATIVRLTSLLDKEVSLYSKEKQPKENIVLLDTLGDLKYLYKFCDLAYVGAGFEKGPHNVLEPLVYGAPTICGPNIEKFPMAQLLSNRSLLFIADKQEDIARQLESLSKINLEEFESRINQFFIDYPDNMNQLLEELAS